MKMSSTGDSPVKWSWRHTSQLATDEPVEADVIDLELGEDGVWAVPA